MNWKQVLYKGLPVVLIAAVIVIVAAIVSKPKAQPTVSKATETVINFPGLNVSKEKLYTMMKQNTGSATLVDIIDRDLLSSYKDQIDQTALQAKIDSDKKSQDQQGKDQFYKNMVLQGVIDSVDDSDRDTKIQTYYLLSFLQKAYATDQAMNALDEKTVQDKIDNYQEDMCIITLKYSTKSAADDAQARLAAATDPEQFYKDEFAAQHTDATVTPQTVTTDQLPFINSDFTCNYNLADYNNYSSRIKFRDFVYSTTNVSTYTTTPKFIADENAFYMVYRLAKPDYKSNYKQSQEFEKYIKDQLIASTVTDTYVKNEMNDFHKSIKLKIYDTELGDQYKTNYDSSFKTESKILDKQTVATYVDPTTKKTVKISADRLYDTMKKRYAIPMLLNKINYAALAQVPGIQMSSKEKQDIVNQIKQYKATYVQKQQQYTWSQFMALNFGAFSENELETILEGPTLTNRYILGYHTDGHNFTGVAELTDAQKEQGYNDYFNITASHILFTYDKDDQASIDKAKEEANQIINGCTDNGNLTVDTCYIFYNPEDSTDTTTPFKGLDETTAADYQKTFSALAKAYSQDPSAATNSGSLGSVTPGKTVKSFEDALIKVSDRVNQGGVPYSLTPVQDESYNGYHVILVTSSDEKPVKPANYTDVKAAIDAGNASDTYTDAQIKAVTDYDDYITKTIVPYLQAKLTTQDNENKLLALLRDKKHFSFEDKDIDAIYKHVQTMQESYDPNSTDSTDTNQ